MANYFQDRVAGAREVVRGAKERQLYADADRRGLIRRGGQQSRGRSGGGLTSQYKTQAQSVISNIPQPDFTGLQRPQYGTSSVDEEVRRHLDEAAAGMREPSQIPDVPRKRVPPEAFIMSALGTALAGAINPQSALAAGAAASQGLMQGRVYLDEEQRKEQQYQMQLAQINDARMRDRFQSSLAIYNVKNQDAQMQNERQFQEQVANLNMETWKVGQEMAAGQARSQAELGMLSSAYSGEMQRQNTGRQIWATLEAQRRGFIQDQEMEGRRQSFEVKLAQAKSEAERDRIRFEYKQFLTEEGGRNYRARLEQLGKLTQEDKRQAGAEKVAKIRAGATVKSAETRAGAQERVADKRLEGVQYGADARYQGKIQGAEIRAGGQQQAAQTRAEGTIAAADIAAQGKMVSADIGAQAKRDVSTQQETGRTSREETRQRRTTERETNRQEARRDLEMFKQFNINQRQGTQITHEEKQLTRRITDSEQNRVAAMERVQFTTEEHNRRAKETRTLLKDWNRQRAEHWRESLKYLNSHREKMRDIQQGNLDQRQLEATQKAADADFDRYIDRQAKLATIAARTMEIYAERSEFASFDLMLARESGDEEALARAEENMEIFTSGVEANNQLLQISTRNLQSSPLGSVSMTPKLAEAVGLLQSVASVSERSAIEAVASGRVEEVDPETIEEAKRLLEESR